jgi:SAM-dependent methyltransferase
VVPDLLAALREDLREAPFTSVGPMARAALDRENPLPARRVLAGRTDATSVLFDLFTLGGEQPRTVVDRAVPGVGVAGLEDLGLVGTADAADGAGAQDPADPVAAAGPGDLVRALVDVSPYAATDDAGEIHWWIASDLSELATGRVLHGDHVLGVGGASLTLARITPRTPVETALDLGCGSGIQALHLSRHADHVVATDLSERALAFAAFNAALNEVALDLRPGSLLDPVAGEAFDLVVSNPPFVITPRELGTTWTYRDGGMGGDTLLGTLLAALPSHLRPGGIAVMLGNWEIGADAAWTSHPHGWLAPASEDGVDAWVIQREQEDVSQYAETWARDGGVIPRDPQWAELQDRWLADFASREVEAVGFGYLFLRRPPSAAPASSAGTAPVPSAGPRRGQVLLEEVPTTGTGTPAEHLSTSLIALGTLADLTDDALLNTYPVHADDVMERRHLHPGEADPILSELVQGAGFARTVPADLALDATFGALDGELRLDQVIGAVCALTDLDVQETTATLLPRVRDLIRVGMLRI